MNLLVDYLFVEILSAPTAESIKDRNQNQIQNQNQIVSNKPRNLTNLMKNAGDRARRTSIATSDAIKVARRRFLAKQGPQESLQIPESTSIAQNQAMISSQNLVQEHMAKLERESSSREVSRSQVKVDQYQRKKRFEDGDASLTQLFSEFVVDLSEQRRTLKPSVRDRYDLLWG